MTFNYMRFLLGSCVGMMALSCTAQSGDRLNLQVHGYATQAVMYTTHNNILTTNSSGGSPGWTEAVLNVSSAPAPKLRVAVQLRYLLLGEVGHTITLDWAAVDYKLNEHVGFRAGKVKTPSGLFNEIQDIGPSYPWALLPQSVYPILSRNSFLANYGGVFYGAVPLGEGLGKLEYRAWAGRLMIAAIDGYTLPLRDVGFSLPDGYSVPETGLALRWRAPLRGLLVGASNSRNGVASSRITAGGGALVGTATNRSFNNAAFFASYERNRWMVAAEYTRLPATASIALPGWPVIPYGFDNRGWYGMATYKISSKLTAGVYQSQFVNHVAALGPGRYSKDWTISGRYDFNQYMYAKAEQHFIDGTALGYSTVQNGGGLKDDTRLSIVKLGVSF